MPPLKRKCKLRWCCWVWDSFFSFRSSHLSLSSFELVASAAGGSKKRKSVRFSPASIHPDLFILFNTNCSPISRCYYAGPGPQRTKAVASGFLFVRQSLSSCPEKRVPRTQAHRVGQDVESKMGRYVRGSEETVSWSRGNAASTVPHRRKALQKRSYPRERVQSSWVTMIVAMWNLSWGTHLRMTLKSSRVFLCCIMDKFYFYIKIIVMLLNWSDLILSLFNFRRSIFKTSSPAITSNRGHGCRW